MASFVAEIKRRKVFRVAVAYALVAWLLIQVVIAIKSPLQLPVWFDTAVIVLLSFGFPIAVIFAWVYEFSGGSLRRTPGVDKPETRPANEGVGSRDAGKPPARVSSLPNSIAVLPFDNMSPSPDHAYFAAGIHEEILNSLANLKSLNVIARTSVLQYTGAQKPIREIAEALGVETIMEGSVRYAGHRVRVTAQLIAASTGAHLWSEAYEREFDDIFAIQADIALRVANAMRAELTKEEQRVIEAPPTTSTAAYAFYLQAVDLGNLPGYVSERVHALLDQAIGLDPRFAAALGTKAAIYATQLVNTSGNVASDSKTLNPLIRKYAAAALAIDPHEPNAHLALGSMAGFTWHWSSARLHVLRALETPRGGVLASSVTWGLSWAGDEELAVERAERLRRLSLTDWASHWSLGIVLNYARRYDQAASALRQATAMMPAVPLCHSWLALTEIALGNASSARQELELTETLLGEQRPIIFLLDLGYAHGRLGDTRKAKQLFDEVQALASKQDIGAGGQALANMAIGRHGEALKWLRVGAEKAARHEVDAGMFSLMNLRQNFTADPTLERPDFVEARRQLKGD